MLVLLLCIEGVLLTIASSSLNIINADDVEQLHPTVLEKYGGISKANIAERSIRNFRNFSTYFQGKDSACKSCGLINSNRKTFLIIKGDIVDPPYKYPWMVRLLINMKRLATGHMSGTSCGGAIINEYYILTAAHCVRNKKRPGTYLGAKDVTVRFLTNTHELTKGSEVEVIIPHPEYDFYDHHDIALLKLKKKIICDMYKSPLCLPPPNLKIPEGTLITIAGWGRTEKEVSSKKLREGVMKNVDFRKCSSVMAVQHLQGNADCYEAVGPKKQDTGRGDSGSPSFYERDGKYYAVGITSGGLNLRSTFTAVPKYVDWIKQVMK